MTLTATSLLLLTAIHSTLAAVLVKQSTSYAYSAWPSNVVTYRMGTGFATEEINALKAAMQQITEDTGRCIQFVQDTAAIGSSSTKPFVQFNHAFPPPGNNASCFTYPGFNQLQLPRNLGQLAVAFGAYGGGNADGACLGAGRERDAMALLVNLLGQPNEWQRSDRETVMTFQGADDASRNNLVKTSLTIKNLFNKANQMTVATSTNMGTFDPLSITMIGGDRYAKDPTRPVFFLPSTAVVGTKAALSVSDCKALMSMYGKYCPATGTGSRPTCTVTDPYATVVPVVPNTNTNINANTNTNIGMPLQFDDQGNPINI